MAECQFCGEEVDGRSLRKHERSCEANPSLDRIEEDDALSAPTELPEKTLRVRLKKDYRPASLQFRVIEEGKPPIPGVGTKGKIWAGSVIDLPYDEAQKLMKNVYTFTESYRDGSGQIRHRVLEREAPIAEWAGDYTV